jgi:S-adenosylmethionine hydrolase
MDKFGAKQVREITNKELFRKTGVSKSFHGRDIFGPTAAYVSMGTAVNKCGDEITNYITLPIQAPTVKDGKIIGEIIFTDKYGNVQVNFGTYILETLRVKLSDIIRIKIGNRTIECPVMRTYGDVPKGNFVIFESSTDFLEIAINEGDAKNFFNAKLGDLVEITKIK